MALPCQHRADNLRPVGDCHWCDLYRTHAAYRALWDGTPPPASPALCLHLGPVVPTESQRTHYRCEAGHGTVCPCMTCKTCPDYAADA